MRWRDFDLGGAFAFVHAAAISAFSLGLIIVHPDEFDPVWAAFFISSSAAAWLGFWAWRRKRWLVAAGAFFLALGWPGGFAIELTGPLVIGLVFVSLFRAWQDRPARRKPVESPDRVP